MFFPFMEGTRWKRWELGYCVITHFLLSEIGNVKEGGRGMRINKTWITDSKKLMTAGADVQILVGEYELWRICGELQPDLHLLNRDMEQTPA